MVNCALGEQLTAPWGRVSFEMSEENAQLLDGAQLADLQRRVETLGQKRLCLEHWLAILEYVEQHTEAAT